MYDSMDDWVRNYQGTYVFFDHEGTTRPLLVADVDYDGEDGSPEEAPIECVHFHGHYYTAQRRHVIGMCAAKCRPALPKLGVMDVDDYVMYATYNNHRQWRKSINPRLVELGSPLLSELNGKVRELKLTGYALYNHLNRKPVVFSEVLDYG